MDAFIALVKQYDAYIILCLVLLMAITILMLIYISTRLYKLSRRYRKFMRGGKDKNIEELLMELSDDVQKAIEKTEGVKSMYGEIDRRLDNCVQKVSIMRYKAFEDMGSAALSFSIALLDAHDDGVILTGIYGREDCTTYAKPIDKGVPKYDLSDEEKQVLQEAMRKK